MVARSIGRLPLPPLRAAAAALSLACAGCLLDGDRRAGVDEFPNSIYARVDGFLDEGSKSEQVGAPALGDSLSLRTGIVVAAAKTASGQALRKLATEAARSPYPAPSGARTAGALGKSAAGCEGLVVTWTDSIGKLAPPKAYTKDTAQVCLDAKAADSIVGNETVLQARSATYFTTGRIETALLTDADGDGIVNTVAGGDSKVGLVLTALEEGVLERTTLIVGPGPDNAFDGPAEADNRIYAASWVRMRGNDTLGSASYADADGDGVAVDNAKASVVDLEIYQKGPSADHPDALWTRASLRMVVRYGVEAKEARKVRFGMEDQARRVTVAEVLGRGGEPEFDMRDTVMARFTTVGTAESDPLDTLSVTLTMALGSDFDRKDDDRVYGLRVVSIPKDGEESRAEFAFTPDGPLPSGADPEDGAIDMALSYRDGTELKLEGTLKAKALDAIVTDRLGNRLHLVWDSRGRVKRQETLK